MSGRREPDERKRQKAAVDAARAAARKRLVEAHPEEYRGYYREEAEKRGVEPRQAPEDEELDQLQPLRHGWSDPIRDAAGIARRGTGISGPEGSR
jgi:hypothetical protein